MMGKKGYIEFGEGSYRVSERARKDRDGVIHSDESNFSVHLKDCLVAVLVPQDPKTDGTAVWWPDKPGLRFNGFGYVEK